MQEYNTQDEKIAAVKALWREWAISIGTLIAVIAFSTVLPPLVVTIVTLVAAWVLRTWAEAKFNDTSIMGCRRFAAIIARSLFISSLIMAGIDILFHTPLVDQLYEGPQINTSIPFVASLIIFPSALGMSILGRIYHGRSHFCHVCKTTHGYSPDEGFVGNFFHIQTRCQLNLMIYLSLAITVIDVLYYWFYYININISPSDRFFFVIMPVVLYLASLLYIWRHYYAVILDLKEQRDTPTVGVKPTIMRFLIIRDDMLLLDKGVHNLLDTPAECTLDVLYPSEHDAVLVFERMSGLKPSEFKMRRLYDNRTLSYRSTIHHYLVDVVGNYGEKMPEEWKLKGEWATLATIDRLMKMHMLSPALGAEIYRVYTIAMAWKTYDRAGRRQYPIRNYHPTFRLRDISRWDVDYNDLSWLDVASNNQDRRLWHIRRLWRRLFKVIPHSKRVG